MTYYMRLRLPAGSLRALTADWGGPSPSEQSIRLLRGYGMRRPAGAPAADGLLERDRRSFAHSSYEHSITVERYLRAIRCNAARGSRGHRAR